MILRLLLAVWLVACHCTSGAEGEGSSVADCKKQNNFTFLGTMDNIEFYAEYESRLNWHEGRVMCLQNGMELASIKTRAQSEMIAEALANITDFWFWTNLRENRNLATMLVFDDTLAHPDHKIFSDIVNNRVGYPFEICGMWDLAGGGRLMIQSCYDSRFTLCQKRISQC